MCQSLRGASAHLGSLVNKQLLRAAILGALVCLEQGANHGKRQKNQSGVGPEGKIPVILGRWNSCDSRKRQNLSPVACVSL